MAPIKSTRRAWRRASGVAAEASSSDALLAEPANHRPQEDNIDAAGTDAINAPAVEAQADGKRQRSDAQTTSVSSASAADSHCHVQEHLLKGATPPRTPHHSSHFTRLAPARHPHSPPQFCRSAIWNAHSSHSSAPTSPLWGQQRYDGG